MVRRVLGDPGRFSGPAVWPLGDRSRIGPIRAGLQPVRIRTAFSILFADPADVRMIAILLRWRAIPHFGTALKPRRGPLRRGAER
jgi:hypothetical protein